MGTVECYICSHMAIWERCSHMTLSERPILYNYAVGRGANVLEKVAQVVRCNNHARACQAAHSLPRASISPTVVTCLTNLSSGGEALPSLRRQSRL